MIRVTAAIIRRDGRVLLARRGVGASLAGKWEFPGGKVEEGEAPEACLARELREELAVEARVGEHVATSVHRYDHAQVELMAFEVELVGGNLRPCEHDRVEWVAPERLLDYELAEADVPIARVVAERAAADA